MDFRVVNKPRVPGLEDWVADEAADDDEGLTSAGGEGGLEADGAPVNDGGGGAAPAAADEVRTSNDGNEKLGLDESSDESSGAEGGEEGAEG